MLCLYFSKLFKEIKKIKINQYYIDITENKESQENLMGFCAKYF